MNTDRGYFAYPAGGADGSKTDGPTLHTINGGAFVINITAPTITNEYTYTFRLVNLPDGLSIPLQLYVMAIMQMDAVLSR